MPRGDEAATGKEASDIATRKQTLPLLYGLEHARGADRDRLDAVLASDRAAPSVSEIADVRAILEQTGARDYSREQAQRYRDEALSVIAGVDGIDREAVKRLSQIVRAAISA